MYLLDDSGEGHALEELMKSNGDEEGLELIVGGHSQSDTNNNTTEERGNQR